ncbi:MAG TPA: serine/threonine-protein kinase [Polyangiaceae bacterium]|nr:serine/threonine-protein kinase [Polyangiaceae bacterium]
MSFDSGKQPPDELDLLVGSTVAGKYHIDRLIGRGGMGAVFQATNAGIGKRVALKFLGPLTSKDSDAATRFQREAEAASLAESPHIVQIFDSGRSEHGLPFLVMELLTGEDLRARLRREGRLDPESAVRIGVQVLKALRQAHGAGIVHRDLKPDNVFLCRRDDEPSFVKIVDFGISKLQQQAGVDTLTHKGAVLGTAFYMSPEQAQSFPDIDGRTDLFSLGAILFEMLTGQPPHSAPTYEAVLIAICTRDAADVRTLAPEVPEKLARVIARALRRDRDERYASAQDMLADLEAALRQSRELAAKTRTTAGVWLDAPKSARPERYRTLVFVVMAALGGFSLAAYFIARSASSPEALVNADVAPGAAPANAPSVDAPALPSAPALAPAPLTSASATVTAKPALKPSQSRPSDSAKPVVKKPPPAASTGVAGGLGLSTREP